MARTVKYYFYLILMCCCLPVHTYSAPSALTKGCADCHGDNGVSKVTDVPTIAGLSEFYFEEQMFAYREKSRPCVESKYHAGDTARAPTTMCALSEKLTDAEIKEMASHFAGLKFVPAKQQFDSALAAKGGKIHDRDCEKCHSEGGSLAFDDAGILAGQSMGYLQQAMDEYKSGKRPMDDKMAVKVEKLSKDDIKALVHYYGSLQGATSKK